MELGFLEDKQIEMMMMVGWWYRYRYDVVLALKVNWKYNNPSHPYPFDVPRT
jgi:hypothetical protein